MKRTLWLMAIVGAIALPGGLLTIAGCGGGGGPLGGQEAGTLPSPSAQFLALLPDAQKAATFVGSNACNCHNGPNHEANFTGWQGTKHFQNGVGCENCHGPGSVHVANPSTANILTFPNAVDAVVCGQCHGPIFDQFSTSKHALVVEDVITEGKANPSVFVRTCFRCHSEQFRVQNVDVPLSHGVSRDQVDTNIQAIPSATLATFPDLTVHSAACTNCHDPHQKRGNTVASGDDFQLRRKAFNTDTTDVAPGAPAKTHTTFDHICGSCHNGRGANGSDAAITSNTSRPNMHEGPQFNMLMGIGGAEGTGPPGGVRTSSHATVPDQCVHCHMASARHTFTVSLDTGCTPCHTPTDAAARVTATKTEISNDLVGLRTRMERFAAATFGDPDLWNYTSNIQTEGKTPPDQSLVPIQVKRARHDFYLILNDRSVGVHNAVYTRFLLAFANDQLDQLGIPRAALRGATLKQNLQILQRDLWINHAGEKLSHGM